MQPVASESRAVVARRLVVEIQSLASRQELLGIDDRATTIHLTNPLGHFTRGGCVVAPQRVDRLL